MEKPPMSALGQDAEKSRSHTNNIEEMPTVIVPIPDHLSTKKGIGQQPTMLLPTTPRPPSPSGLQPTPRRKSKLLAALLVATSIAVITGGSILAFSRLSNPTASTPVVQQTTTPPTPTPTPTPVFDPSVGAILPKHRVIAYYAVPGAEVTGPAYQVNADMLQKLKQQGAEFEQLDPAHPVKLGIDLVVSVPDPFPGPNGHYSHHVDEQTIQTYVDFCQKHDLLLFLDLNFGQAPVIEELNFFMPYFQKYDFVHLAIDPEWMFPRKDGIPGTNLSNVRAADLNPIIQAMAEVPMKYKVPRKMMIIHQYRPSGDTLKDPYNAGKAEIADKRNLILDPRVDVVLHVDSVGGYPGDIEDKQQQYKEWVRDDMKNFNNFSYGGFKIFLWIEAKTRLMTPTEIMAMDPAPMVITYGN